MDNLIVFIKKNRITILKTLIILLAIFLRFYNYGDRWGLGYDQAHDAIVAQYALHHFKLPLLGPFSSAGAFVTGPEWYWFIMLGTLVFTWSVLSPWIVLTIMSVLFVYLMMKIADEIGGSVMAIIVGLFSAVSSSEISQSLNLTNQAPLSILSAIAVWATLMSLKTKKNVYVFILGLSTALGINIHLQGILILSFSFVFFLISYKNLKIFFPWIIGFIIPFVPLIYFDLTHNFYDLRNLLQYYLIDQYKISLDVLGRRWLTYIGILWPGLIANVIGGNAIIGYFISIISFVVLTYAFFRRSVPKIIFLVSVSCIISLIFIRYTRTPIFESYIMFMHPWVFLIVGWVILFISKKNMILGFTFLAAICIGSVYKDIIQITNSNNYTATLASNWSEELLKKYPSKKFAVYDYKYVTAGKSLALVLYLDKLGKIDNNGFKVGLTISTPGASLVFPSIIGEKGGYQIFNLDSSSSSEILNDEWILLNSGKVYSSTEEWYFDKKL